jgi:hypothetical protein
VFHESNIHLPSYDIKGNWFQFYDYFLYQNVICLVITLQNLHQSSLAGYVKIKSPMYINISICSRSIKVHRWNSRHLNPDTRCNTGNSVMLQPLHPTETFKNDSEFVPELYCEYVAGANGIRHSGEGRSRGQFKIWFVLYIRGKSTDTLQTSGYHADGRWTKFCLKSFELLSVGYFHQLMFRICRHIVKYVSNKQ